MRMSQEEKEKSRQRIVANASRRFRERGIEGTSLADVMKDAGMTHGGFYKHFETKDALLETALAATFDGIVAQLETGDPKAAFEAYRDLYRSELHRSHPGMGCPVATLGSEVGRHAEGTKSRFGQGVRRVVERIARVMRGSPPARQAAAYREFAMMVGAIVIARASDPTTAREVLDAARGDRPRLQENPLVEALSSTR
jgi:TetR/AcrR family transcriptional repressor of nem operon